MPKKKERAAKPDLPTGAPADRSAGNVGSTGWNGKAFPIVGLGASAGGLESLKAFFSKVPQDSGLAYIVVVHMAPKQPSMMAELLQKVACIPIKPAEDGERVQANHAYVIPPNHDINIYQGAIQLLALMARPNHLPIDFFFQSLAQDQTANSVGVVLSGTGTDGSLGLKAIRSAGGLTLVQTEASAKYDGMPKSAMKSGAVDMVSNPDEMPPKLIQYFSRAGNLPTPDPAGKTDAMQGQQLWLPKIFALLRSQTGHDFSAYKENTILRRISRRMGLNHIDQHDTYIHLLREDTHEVEALFRDLLIGATSFFRDRPSFDVLKNDILPEIFDKMPDQATFRAWIPGCSTGEEVYSLAMVFRECLDENTKGIRLQLFGTDIDKSAIHTAREGLFPASISADVGQERLKRFFSKDGDHFRICKAVRDAVMFSVQDIIKDPPFSRLNLLCCRNLLIYLDTAAQKKILPLFHYTLTTGGILVLGASETIGGFTNLFETIDKQWKIFRSRDVPRALRAPIAFPTGLAAGFAAHGHGPAPEKNQTADISAATRQAVLDRFAPPAVLIDAQGNMLHIQGRTGKYLETPSGPPSRNILDMARMGLRIELSSAIRSAVLSGKMMTRRRVRVRINGDIQIIDLHVCPLSQPKVLAGRLLVVFQDIAVEADGLPMNKAVAAGDAGNGEARVGELERELQHTRESHQTTLEELETSNEELKSANEELQSSNEELQSTNEELESSKEELQSLNEELQTINSELQSKVEELSAIHDDLHNLLNSTELATIFVDNQMGIKRFTPAATQIVNLIPTDLGRPIQHVATNLSDDQFIQDLEQVLDKLTTHEKEVQTTDGKWYLMRIIPYRTTDNRIDGAVLTFAGIEEQKQAQQVLQTNMEMELLLRNVFDTNLIPMAVLDEKGRLVIANARFQELMNLPPDSLQGCNLLCLEEGVLGLTDLAEKLKTALARNQDFISTLIRLDSSAGPKTISIGGRIVRQGPNRPYRILLYFNEMAIVGDSDESKSEPKP